LSGFDSGDESKAYIDGYIARARKAQEAFGASAQDRLDAAARAAGKAVFDNAEALARLAVDETGMGVCEDKAFKNRNKARMIWNSLKGRRSCGAIARDEASGITEIAKPVGVVAAITPCTNPIATPMSNCMFALKGGNAIIITPHHRSAGSSAATVELIDAALRKLGLPENLVQIVGVHSRENTRNLMAAADMVVATGGAGMVKAAYSSGRPALGVGVGNVQCIVDDSADLADAAAKTVAGRCFDNGILCSAEQSAIISDGAFDGFVAALEANGAFVVRGGADRAALRAALFPDGEMSRHAVGQSAAEVARLAGISLPGGARAIAVVAEGPGGADPLSREKMCPVLALFRARDFRDAVEIARENLENEGKGHSVSIHSRSEENIWYAAERLSVSRFLVNQCSATNAGGSFSNGLAPTSTLGCGTWGNNSISENLNYRHFINVSRIALDMQGRAVPTDDEIWGPDSPAARPLPPVDRETGKDGADSGH
jgi:succinate-semialdehyde dehydrogenase